MTITQTISTFSGTTPDKDTQTPSAFSTNADALAQSMTAWPTEYNTLATQANTLATTVSTSETNAVAAAAVSQANANFKGAWSAQTGEAAIPYSVRHNSKNYMLILGLANVTTVEPGVTAGWATYWTDITAIGLTANVFTGQQTFVETKDTVYNITDGAAFEIDPVNGNIQTVTLGDDRTPLATNFEAGQCILLGIDDGTSYAVTWSGVGVTWVTKGGTASAPTLVASGYTWVMLWMQGSTIFGTEVGSI